MNDIIFALSSGHGKSGVAVIRISGKFHPSSFILHPLIPRRATLVNLTDNAGALIDQCIAIYFPAPHSFTGEDVIELHTHGSSAVVEKVFGFLSNIQSPISNHFRQAAPGEFSRRAFMNNKMDLTEVDGLAALLDARTDRQRALALKSMTGGDRTVFETWRSQMIEIAAYAAAQLDYPADELPENIGEKLLARTQKLYDEINSAISRYAAVRAIQGGFNIVLAGDTNVGKSSLFNRLVGSARAIVSDIPGTTRDVVSAQLDIDGYLVNLSDTAGLRDSDDEIEQIGIQRTHEQIENADLILQVVGTNINSPKSITDNEIIVFNKSDINTFNISHLPCAICVSALTGAGIPELLDLIKQKIHAALDGAESDIAVNARTREQLLIARNELKLSITNYKLSIELFSEHIRVAADAIGRILGTIDASEIMDATFSGLCLGK